MVIEMSQRIKTCIEEKFPKAKIVVHGDRSHIEAWVVSSLFHDKSFSLRHQMVYNALGDKLCSSVNGFTIHTFTPEEAKNQTI